jgi:LysM repeat protein
MNNPNPFVPKGSLLEQQSKRRSRLKLAVFCVLAVGVAGLSAMLIQGCKREQPPTDETSTPTIDTNPPAITDTNPPAIDTNPPVVTPPVAVTPPVVTPPVEAAGAEYTVAKGDTLGKIAKKNGVSVKALEAANPGIVPTKLKVGQKLTLPAGGSVAPAAAAQSTGTSAGGETYTIKSGDTLTKVAHAHGVTLKALKATNPNVDPNHIKVGDKLTIPSKAEAAAPAAAATAPEPAPVAPAPVAPVTMPSTTPAK